MKVLLLCARGFEMMEFSAFTDVMGWAKTDYGYDTDIDTCGLTKTVVSAFGVSVTMDKLIEELDPKDYDALAIPGGAEAYGFYEEAYAPAFLQLIRDFNTAGKPIASVCVAALALGKSGILRGRRATTYPRQGGHRLAQLAEFGVPVTADESIVTDGNVITSHGPETAVHVAFLLLERLTDRNRMQVVKQAMGY